jgi:L-ascorbate metabolism protein UlaG (beta-lactamase superfamily)
MGLLATTAVIVPAPATAQITAQAPPPSPMPDRCLAVAQAPRPGPRLVQRAQFRPEMLQPAQIKLTFVGHATWLIETPGGVRAATDYNDYIRPAVVPDIATMNKAHTTHYSLLPDPEIKHVLRGWNPEGGAAHHDLTVGDVRVRNVPTNIRDWQGGAIGHGNSIFIFETAGLCIGHLGHLHHTLTPEQIGQIGQLDVVMVPIDGSYTLDTSGMVEVVKALRARLILPMHYFNQFTLNRFLDKVRGDFPIEMAETNVLDISHAKLPANPKILVLPGM